MTRLYLATAYANEVGPNLKFKTRETKRSNQRDTENNAWEERTSTRA